MSDVVISIENVSKSYHLGVINTGTFYGDVRRWWARKRGLPDPFMVIGEDDHGNRSGEVVWALKDVSLQIKQGEAVGIIGRNGAGKSTLLKILSRVTAPTSGEIKTKGRIASLLEVGTGFHPDLTGRENVFMNGAILGMSRAEIARKFDEIVEFSSVTKYIDTPVKHYSSGMRVRLAFSVAAHLDPEIMVVDEVLAVGDIGFQKKGFDKMEEAGKSGRTVLVVSHNMMFINRLCSRAVLLNAGGIEMQGATIDVVNQYLATNLVYPGRRVWNEEEYPGDDIVRLRSVRVCTEEGTTVESYDIRKPIFIEFEYNVLQEGASVHPSFYLVDGMANIVFISGGMHAPEWADRPRKAGWYTSRCIIPGNLLAEGTFSIRALINTMYWDRKPDVHVDVRDAVSFNVHDTIEGDSARGKHIGAYYGIVRPILKWETWAG